MSKKITKRNKFIPETTVLTARIKVARKSVIEAGGQNRLEAELDLELKIMELDLSSYRRLSVENVRILGEALIALSKEGQAALDNL